MSEAHPKEPTADECSQHAEWHDERLGACVAFWFPQLGGYVAKAVVAPDQGCLAVWVWHDGDFPFSGDKQAPRELHVCDPEQFIALGTFLTAFLDRQPKEEAKE